MLLKVHFPNAFFLAMNFELKDVVSTAGATVGLVIATSIFMQLLTTKAIALFERYRALGGEYRASRLKPERNRNLGRQIDLYRRRCHLIQTALAWLAWAEIIFLITILFSSASILFPKVAWIKFVGAASTVAGLVAIAGRVLLEIRENSCGQKSIESETSDLSEASGESR